MNRVLCFFRMYLKRLEIQGFKSFARKTVLDFLPPHSGRFSVTAVVGPNGAGKSNISDAILWVMGEQSLKVLRGKKSEDVIFGGSDTKSQQGAAEVTMVLDNADGRVLGDYPEVVVTRRLYRSGEGEYLINNKQARLFDVHLLLAQAQFGQHSYSVVGQGMIDRLLTVNAAERKDFLDEASGIKEFQIKRHQADLKLARTAENMEQARRLLQEVEPRLKILARQVKKLEKRQEVELRLRETQEKYYSSVYLKNQKEVAVLGARLTEVEAAYRAAFAELEKTQTELAELARSSTRQEVFQELQGAYQSAARLKNEVEKQMAILEGQAHAEYAQTGRQNIGWLEGKIKELAAGRKKLANDLLSAEAEERRVRQAAREQESALDNLSAERVQQGLKISRLQSEIFKDQSEQNYLQFSGLTAVKAVLEARQNFGAVHGLVAELGEVEEEYRLALETAGSAHLSSIVVEDERVARLAIDYLRAHRFGVATFLPLNKIQPRPTYGEAEALLSEPGVLGLALDFLKFDQKFSDIFSFILGNMLVVKDLAVAERIGIGRARMVTLAGDLADKNGVMKGGYRQRKNNLTFSAKLSFHGEDRLAEYQAQINLEQGNLSDLEKKIEVGKAKLLEARVQARSAEAKVNMFKEESNKLEKEIAGLERELSLQKGDTGDDSGRLEKLRAAKQQLAAELMERERALDAAALAIAEFNEQEEKKKQRVFALQNEMQKKQETVNNILAERNDLKIAEAKLETKQEDLEQEVKNEMNASLASIMVRNSSAVAEDEWGGLAGDIQKWKYQLSLIGGIDEEVSGEYQTTKERHDFLTGQLDDLSRATADLEKMTAELDELMKRRRAAAFQKIRKEFGRYFKILFGGGSAGLEEIYGDSEPDVEMLSPDAAEDGVYPAQPAGRSREKILTGIEVAVHPPGKKIKHINALSGGERTLTATALICAILNCNPSPFVVLDEVEAALDEANTARFVRIMSELAAQSQFIIITHNRVTMHAADALYGVVMGGDGTSKLLSVKMEEAEKYEQGPNIDKKVQV